MNEIRILSFLRITKSEYKHISDDALQLAELIDDVSTELLDSYEKEPDKQLAVRILGSDLFRVLTDELKTNPSFTLRVSDVIAELEGVKPQEIKEVVQTIEDKRNEEDEDMIRKINELEI